MDTLSAPAARRPPPAGTRPPPPPWARIAAWAAVIACLALLAAGGPVLAWAQAQADPSPGKVDAARVARALLLPPGARVVAGVAALGMAALAGELALGALALAAHAEGVRRQGTLALAVLLPRPQPGRPGAGTDLLRALHAALPPGGLGGPWLALTIGARPDEPAELGAVIGGGTARQRMHWAAALRKAAQGLEPGAVVEERADPLAEALRPGRAVAWAEWLPALPPAYPLRLHDDREQGELLGPLAAAVAPRPGAAYVELHVALQPLRADAGLARGWRAQGLRRLLRLKARHDYALPPDGRALEQKLAAPAFRATLRAVAVADGARPDAARAELDELASVLGQYEARSGGRLQRWARRGGGVRIVARPATWRDHARALAAGVAAAALALGVAGGEGAALALARLPWTGAALGWLAPALAGLLAASLAGRPSRAQQERLARRAPRPAPPPAPLCGAAFRGPAVLCPEELAGLWALPGAGLGRLVRWLPCRHLPPPPHAFVPDRAGAPWLALGTGRHLDGSEGLVGLPLRDARQGLAFTAPPGVGKTQLASNLADQLLPHGYTLIDGKGDDAGNLVETVRRRVPLADEGRVVVLDVLDAEWPVGLNPLAGIDARDAGALDQALGQCEGIFARLDPETWAKAPRMKNYLRKAALLVLAGEERPTLAHVKQALLDERYRQRLLPRCTNVEVTDFWTVEFPQIGEQQRASRDALVSRFDMLLDSELTRHLFNQAAPALSFADAIAERLVVLAPLPHRALGALAGPVGMLLFQSLMRAAFSRPGTDLTRAEYGFIGDEFQVLVENCDTKDVRDALTQVRAFGIVTIIANQLQAQLGDLADYALTAVSNRVLLRTQEPDASLYARHYAESGVGASDISGQEPREHQYAWVSVGGRLTRLFSMRPLPWLPPLAPAAPPYAGPPWQGVLPPSPAPALDAQVLALVYGEHPERQRVVDALAATPEERWAAVLASWERIRAFQRAYILANPGCVPDARERQRWLSRLRAARPRVLAQAEYARVRRAVQAGGQPPRSRAQAGPPAADGGQQAEPPSQRPHHLELDEREPPRLARIEPDDFQVGEAP